MGSVWASTNPRYNQLSKLCRLVAHPLTFTTTPIGQRTVRTRSRMGDQPNYAHWSHEKLVRRVTELEGKLRERNDKFGKLLAGGGNGKHMFQKRSSENSNGFDPAKYNTRYIAIKLAYLGKNYNGFEYTPNNSTPLPTIEEKLWDALSKTKLIFPASDEPYSFEGCEYSKCGRTDKGVSAFGQVIAIRVRSNEPKEVEGQETPDWDAIKDEIDYTRTLNRVLPDDIRALAWCAAPSPDFSARFSCEQRQYRYFFTQPSYPPLPSATGNGNGGETALDGWLDIDAMQEAAKLFEGLHDFRNFCKQDTHRQITNFLRRITHSSIEEASSSSGLLEFVHAIPHPSQDAAKWVPKVYCFKLHGSAFLWHQVRCMVSILFLVGQGFEKPSIVSELFKVDENTGKPIYEMADDTPLVLWDCIFPKRKDDVSKDALPWIYEGQQFCNIPNYRSEDIWSSPRTMGRIWALWRKRKMDEILAASLLDTVVKRRKDGEQVVLDGNTDQEQPVNGSNTSVRIFEGGDEGRPRGNYIPILQRERHESTEVRNTRWRTRKGAKAGQDSADLDE